MDENSKESRWMLLKKYIKKGYWGQLVISYLHCLESGIIPLIIKDEIAVKRYFKNCTHRELNLINPTSFSEKMNWYKLYSHNPLMVKCADKVGVREYITECGFGNNLNEVYGVYKNVNDIPFNSLPEAYVLKAAHGSHMSIIKKPGEILNIIQAKMMMNSWLHQNIYWSGREWVYKDIPRRIIVEKYLEDETGELRDYKFFCFNGIPSYLQYDGGRFTNNHFRNYYDMTYQLLPLRDDVPCDPEHELSVSISVLDEMKNMAQILAKPFQFVRIDFYCIHSQILIGELTFFHNGGITWFDPEEYDLEFGSKWKLIYE